MTFSTFFRNQYRHESSIERTRANGIAGGNAARATLAVVLLACGSSESSGPSASALGLSPDDQDGLEELHDANCGTGDATAYEEWAVAQQREECERQNSCCNETRDCANAAFGAGFISPIRDAMTCGLSTFDRAAADRCIQARAQASCTATPAYCADELFVIGKLGSGDACKDGAADCGPGLYCESGNHILGYGTCKAAKSLGQACDGANVCGANDCSLSHDVCEAPDGRLICQI